MSSISTVPDIPDKTEVERGEESQWSEKAQHAMASITSQAQLNSYSGIVVLSAVQLLLFMSSSRSHCFCNEESWRLTESTRWDPFS